MDEQCPTVVSAQGVLWGRTRLLRKAQKQKNRGCGFFASSVSGVSSGKRPKLVQVSETFVEAPGIDPKGDDPAKQKSRERGFFVGWRRRESNPGPQGLEFTFVHVRSRRIPCDWVRGFGHDLSLTFSRPRYRGHPRAIQPCG